MTKDKKTTESSSKKVETSNKVEERNAESLQLQILAQYLKDVSFESPNAPYSLRAGQENPKTELSFNLETREIDKEKGSDLYEVAIKVTAKAIRGKDVVFITEVDYGTLVSMKGVPAEKIGPLLLIEVPRLTFPFVRKVIADLTQEGGFPPLLLNPVDFTSLYKKGSDKAKASKKTK